MLKELTKLFERYTEAVVILQGDDVVWKNAAAKEIFPDDALTSADILPDALQENRGANTVTETEIGGREFAVSTAELNGFTVVSFREQNAAEKRETLLSYTGGYVKNAMSVLRMSADFLRPHIEQMQDPQLDKYTAMMYHSYYSLLNVSNNLAYMAEDEGAFRFGKKLVDMEELCSKVVDAVNCVAAPKHACVALSPASEKLWVQGSEKALENLLLNLLANSLKYTPAEGKITVSLSKRGKKIIITVSDTGSGIPEERMATVFSRCTVPPETRGADEGLGVGLSVVMKTAKKHGGSVLLESRENQGTRVTVILPEAENCDAFSTSTVTYESGGMNEVLTVLAEVLPYESYMSKFTD